MGWWSRPGNFIIRACRPDYCCYTPPGSTKGFSQTLGLSSSHLPIHSSVHSHLQHSQYGCIRGGPANTQPFQSLDEGSLAVTRRRSTGVLDRREVLWTDQVPCLPICRHRHSMHSTTVMYSQGGLKSLSHPTGWRAGFER